MRVAGLAVPALLAAVLGLIPTAAQGQEGPRTIVPAAPRDFLFGRPQGEASIRVGWNVARAGSDWYDFVTDQLTLDRRDFDAVTVAGDVGAWLSDRAALVIGAEVTHSGAPSEYRRFVDNNRQAIVQSTRLVTFAATGGVKYALADRGRGIGQLAWIPGRVVPFVTAGGGVTSYRLRQSGDFVDFADAGVFPSTFASSGWAPVYYVGGGVDVRVGRRLQLTTDVKYRRAAAALDEAWVDFDPLDLSGVRITFGATIPF